MPPFIMFHLIVPGFGLGCQIVRQERGKKSLMVFLEGSSLLCKIQDMKNATGT